MTVATFRQTCLLALLLAVAAPATALAVNPAMQKASLSLAAKGEAAAAKGEAARARQLLEESIVADPANAHALSLLARLYQSQGKTPLARKYYAIALDVDPSAPDALLGAGEIDIAEGKPDDAGAKLRVLKSTCPACRQTEALERALSEKAMPGKSPVQVPHP